MNMEKLKELIDLFEHNIKQYKGKHYDEAKTRVDFIDKFFMLLEWDVYNEKDYSEQYRDVVREDKIEIKGKVKAPDYSFRIGGFRKFFVEAKKPSVNIKHDIEPAFQLRRYAYTAKLPLSILTDFEEFAVYDTRIKPDKHDQASTARIFYCTYEDYEKEFDFIFNTFSRHAILKGSFDQYIEDTKRKKGTSEVDKEFLKFIEKWRENLAKNIALRNKNLTIYELNYAVQKIIDRIIFLRIAEDRDVEDYGKIQKLLENKKTIYPQLVNLFLKADVKYDSGLFNFKADQVTPELKIDDKILKDIIKSIYYPDSPYEFSVFDVEILGNIYEQFLGKTIRLTASHQAKIENKPEVKKAGGVYYTPKYIVDYIVKNTVGEKIKNKTPDQISKLKILDPACGCGSFLLGAYQMLMNYHLEYYTKDKNIKKSLKENKIYQIKENEYRLTIEEKHRILLNNIFGVDIDSQAVEVTKLSLLLKLMEGESQESAGMLFKFSDIKMLPDLSENIKCGNSLIGSDFYETSQMSLFQDEETTRRINVFDWHKEFPDIFTQGGFDIVIGNPPYVKARDYDSDKEFYRNYLNSNPKFTTLYKMWDLYIPFVEKGISLLREDGFFGMIVPDTIEKSEYASKLRKWIVDNYYLYQIDFFPDSQIFISQNKVIGVKNTIFFIKKTTKFNYVKRIFHDKNYTKISKEEKVKHNIELFFQYQSKIDFNKIETIPLGNICFTSYGLRLNSDKSNKISFKKADLLSDKKSDIHIKKYTEGKFLNRYFINKSLWVEWNTYRCPKLLVRPTFPELYEPEKILLGRQTKVATIDKERHIVDNTIIICTQYIKLKGIENRNLNKYFSNIKISRNELEEFSQSFNLKFILGVINSRLIKYYIKILTQNSIDMFPDDWKKIPIPVLKNKKILNDKMVEMVDQMLEVQKKYHNAKTENEKIIYKKQIDILDNQIDQLVYKLYGLTEEEIKIVENS